MSNIIGTPRITYTTIFLGAKQYCRRLSRLRFPIPEGLGLCVRNCFTFLPREIIFNDAATRARPVSLLLPGRMRRAPPGQREKFGAEELAIVLSHFDIGVIDSIVEFPRGSRKAPKLLIVSEQGKFLLKRRARGKDDPFKVAFCHAIQLYLASKQFPLPHLIGTKKDNNSMLQWRNGVYELFEYIPGQAIRRRWRATFDCGRVLALYHKLLEDFNSEWTAADGQLSHARRRSSRGCESIPTNAAGG